MPGADDSMLFWKNLRTLMSDVRSNEDLRSKFLETPGDLIRERGLDVEIPPSTDAPDKTEALSKYADRMSRDERAAMLDAFNVASELRVGPDIGRVAIAVPVANVNAAANHNVAANTSSAANAVAAANALAVANTTGVVADSDLVRPGFGAEVRLRDAAIADDLRSVFEQSQLNTSRQAALLKRALTDDASVVEENAADHDAVRRTARFIYRGTPFEVTGTVGLTEVIVEKARLLS